MADKKPTYYELLQDPRWQKKRLELFQAADWRCLDCGESNRTLHVHHSYYERGVKPWEYPNESLTVLCRDCHKVAQDGMTLLHREIGKLGIIGSDVLTGIALAINALIDPDSVIDVNRYEFAVGVGYVLDIEPEELMLVTIDGLIDGHTLWKVSRRPANRQFMFLAVTPKNPDTE